MALLCYFSCIIAISATFLSKSEIKFDFQGAPVWLSKIIKKERKHEQRGQRREYELAL